MIMRPEGLFSKLSLLLLAILFNPLSLVAQISFAPIDTLVYNGSGSVFPSNSVSYVDLDDDSNVDVLALNPLSIIVKRGNGDGTFSENEVWYEQNEEIYSISNPYDINNDGYYDLALMQNQYITILLGTENGFVISEKTSFDTFYGDMRWVDYDKDENVDLVIESSTDILINYNWNSDLSNFESFHQENAYLFLFELVDINLDDNLDLIVSTEAELIIYISENDGTFNEVHSTEIGYRSFEFGDINLDGYIDLVYDYDNELYTLTYDAVNNNFTEANITDSETNINLRNPKLIDLDNNNTLDLVFENKIEGFSYKKNSAGSFGSTEDFNFESRTSNIVHIFGLDLNIDNQVDLIFHGLSNQEIHLLNGDFTVNKSIYNIFFPDFSDMNYEDIDGDGFNDIIAVSEYGKALLFYGNSSNTYSEMIEIPASFSAERCFVTDINSDSIKDIIYTVETNNNGLNDINIIYGEGNRQFAASARAKYFPNPEIVSITDVDNDSIKELLVFERYGNTIAWFEDFDTTDYIEYFSMTNKIEIIDGNGLLNVISGDWNNDSLVDLVAINNDSPKISVLLNNSSGNFNASEISLNNSVNAIQKFEFNNDSIMDLLAVTENNSSFYLIFLTGNNDGTFIKSDSVEISSIYYPRHIDLDDIDLDNDIDILISEWDYTRTKIVENNNSSFVLYNDTEIENIGQGNRIFADLNKNGKTDLLSSTWYGGKLMYQLNNSVVEPLLSDLTVEIKEVTNESIKLKINQDIKTNKIIMAREDTSKILSQKPLDKIFYAANNEFGIGSEIAEAYVIYSGTDTLIEVTGLDNVKRYSFFVFEYATNEPTNNIINYTQDFISIDTITLNATPVFTSTEITGATGNVLYTYNISATDDDANDTLTIVATTLPSWLSFTDNEDGTAKLEGTPLTEHIGSHAVVLELSDSIINTPVIQSFTLVVNGEPYFTSTEITSATENSLYTYDITVADEDAGNTLTLTATTLPTWLTLTDNGDRTAKLEGTPLSEHIGSNPVVLELSDGVVESPIIQNFSIEVTLDVTNSIENIFNNFKIYPNPIRDIVYIDLKENTAVKIVLTDMLGRTISQTFADENIESINTESLESGIYFLIIENNNSKSCFKLIKE